MSIRFIWFVLKSIYNDKKNDLLFEQFHNDSKFEYKAIDYKSNTHILTRFDNKIEHQVYYKDGVKSKYTIDYDTALKVLKRLYGYNFREEVLERFNSKYLNK